MKLHEQLAEVGGAFDDTKDVKLLDDMYSRDEAVEIIKTAKLASLDMIDSQMDNYAQYNALYIYMLLMQAEEKGLKLKIDTKKLEQAVQLGGLEKIFNMDDAEAKSTKLTSLGEGGVDSELVKKMKQMEVQGVSKEKNLVNLTEETKVTLKDNSDMKHQIIALSKQLEDTRTDLENAQSGNEKQQKKLTKSVKASIEGAKEEHEKKIEKLQAEKEETERELAGSIASAAQFKQLKSLIQQKNKYFKTLNAQLNSL